MGARHEVAKHGRQGHCIMVSLESLDLGPGYTRKKAVASSETV